MSNRPFLPAIAHRSAAYGESLARLRAGLATPALAGLRSREPDDPTLALLDAWACAAEVLGFYEERIAQEHYLGTATEPRSLVEVARLAGTAPRPALPATAWLSYTVINGATVTVPSASAVQDMPADASPPQLFETVAPIEARAAWSRMAVAQTAAQAIDATTQELWLQGAALGLASNDLLLLVPDAGTPRAVRIARVEPLVAEDRTHVTLQPEPPAPPERRAWHSPLAVARAAAAALDRPAAPPPRLPPPPLAPEDDSALALLGALHPRAAGRLRRAVAARPLAPGPAWQVLAFRVHAGVFGHNAPKRPTGVPPAPAVEWTLNEADALPREPLAIALQEKADKYELRQLTLGGTTLPPPRPPILLERDAAPTALPFEAAGEQLELALHEDRVTIVFRRRDATLMLGNLRDAPRLEARGTLTLQPVQANGPHGERLIAITGSFAPRGDGRRTEDPARVSLDTTTEAVLPGGWVVLDRPAGLLVTRANAVRARSRADYGITGRVTELELAAPWLAAEDGFAAIRGTTVHAAPELLPLAEAPLPPLLEGDRLPLEAWQEGLQPGRWLILEAERADAAEGLRDAELVRLAAVEQWPAPGRARDALRTTLVLAAPLAATYRRQGAVLHGNVAEARHGGTRTEVLGSGDASQPFQRFTLRQGAAAPGQGVAGGGAEPPSALEITVNGTPWTEVPSLAESRPEDRVYAVQADAAAGTTGILFGDGITGARLPTGQENVLARYRSGGGAAGNLAAGALTLPVSRPLNVDGVTNPMPSSGGAPPEPAEEARRRIPLGLAALDRLVAVQDYADLALCFAGIAKARAVALPRRGGPLVHLTFAAAGGLPAPAGLAESLRAALRERGDPAQAVQVAPARLKLLALAAAVALTPGARWERVEPAIRSALLARFGFAARAIGAGVPASAVIAAIQRVPGVAWLRLERLAFLTPEVTEEDLAALGEAGVQDIAAGPARLAGQDVVPAEIAFLSEAVPALVQLQQVAP